jgi:AcrB/AcrD/AcrF family
MRLRWFEFLIPGLMLNLAAAGCGDAEKDANVGAPPPLKLKQVSDPNVFQVDHPDQFPLVAAVEHFAALSHGIGSDSHRPFAIVIVGGLISDLVMSIFLLPTLYVWFAHDGDKLPRPEEAV